MTDGNQLIELFRHRQSVRSYSNKPVEKEKLMRCIEAARIAPSASNAQPWKFIIIDDPETKNKAAGFTTGELLSINRFSSEAPVLVAIVRERANFMSGVGQVLKNKEYPLIDIGISTIQFCLQATAEGLGTCIMGWFNEKKLNKLLNIPRSKRLELVITVGYAKTEEIRTKKRKDMNEILSFNTY